MEDLAAGFATPRLASGALFVDRDRILLVRKTYGNHWDIPGGYVDRGESPASACEREVREELGLARTAERLLIHDWAPSDTEGDKALYIFDCGELGGDEHRIRLDRAEIEKTEWVAAGDLARFVIPRLIRRLTNAYRAYTSGTFLYLEHGQTRNLDRGTDSLRGGLSLSPGGSTSGTDPRPLVNGGANGRGPGTVGRGKIKGGHLYRAH